MVTYFGLDLLTSVKINMVLQTAAYLLLLAGCYFARKKIFSKHKIIMTTATVLIIASLAIVMLPSFYSVVSGISPATISSINSLTLLIIFHHSLGLIALVMALLVTVRSCYKIDTLWNRRKHMLVLFTIWSVAYFLGVVIYFLLYY